MQKWFTENTSQGIYSKKKKHFAEVFEFVFFRRKVNSKNFCAIASAHEYAKRFTPVHAD